MLLQCGGVTLAGWLPDAHSALSHPTSLKGQEKIRWKSLWVKTGKWLTNYRC